MPTQCNPGLFDFAAVEGRQVVGAFDGGVITSDAGALLLGAPGRAIRLTERFTTCFADRRTPELVEHSVRAMLVQRVFGIALGYEDLTDHDELRSRPSTWWKLHWVEVATGHAAAVAICVGIASINGGVSSVIASVCM